MIGIDSFWVMLREYEVQADHWLMIEQPTVDNRTGELIGENQLFSIEGGEIVFGKKAYGNFDYFRVTVAPSHQGVGFYVNFNIPKIFHDSDVNFEAVKNSDTFEVIDSMNCLLENVGIKTDIWKARITRVDLFSNVEAEHAFESYIPVLQLLKAKRMKSTPFNEKTMTWFNSAQEFQGYDKIDESERKVKKEKLKKAELREIMAKYGGNVHRYEQRIKKSRKLKSQVHFDTVEDLRGDGIDRLKRNYKRQFKDNIFRADSHDLVAWTDTEITQDMMYFMENHGRNWLNKWLSYRGLMVIKSLTSTENLKQCLLNTTGDRNKAWRLECKLNQVLAYKKEDSFLWSSISKLYAELKKKIVYQEIN